MTLRKKETYIDSNGILREYATAPKRKVVSFDSYAAGAKPAPVLELEPGETAPVSTPVVSTGFTNVIDKTATGKVTVKPVEVAPVTVTPDGVPLDANGKVILTPEQAKILGAINFPVMPQGTDVSKISTTTINVTPEVQAKNVFKADLSEGGQIIKTDGTVILNNGTVIEPVKPIEGSTAFVYKNVDINTDGSVTLPTGDVIKPISPSENVLIVPSGEAFVLPKEGGNVDPNLKFATDDLIPVPPDSIIAQTNTTKELSFLDRIVEVIYKTLYTNGN